MKKLWYLIAVFAIISCRNEAPNEYAVLTGKIQNKGETEFSINSMDGSIKEIIDVADDGSFVDTLKFEIGTYVLFDGKNQIQIYLEPGYSLNVLYNAIDFSNTLSFKGDGSEIASYLYDKVKKINELVGDPKIAFELEEDEYKAKFSEIKTVLSEMITGAAGISEEYKAKELRNLHYGYLSKLSVYPMYHAYIAKKPNFKVSKEFLIELKDLDYGNEEDFMFSSEYKQLLVAHYSSTASMLAIKDSIAPELAYLKSVASIKNETIKNELLFTSAKKEITTTKDLEEFFRLFMAASTNDEHNKVITESYNNLLKDSREKI